MKKLKLEYPDSTIHEIKVLKLGYIRNLDRYLMHYYDYTNKKVMYTVLEKEADRFYKNPEFDGITLLKDIASYERVDKGILPDKIFCRKNVQSIPTTPPIPPTEPYQSIELFTVYHDIISNKYYIALDLALEFNIKGSSKQMIDDISCVEITMEQIKFIEESTKNNNPRLKASYKEIKLNKVFSKFFENNYSKSGGKAFATIPPTVPPTDIFDDDNKKHHTTLTVSIIVLNGELFISYDNLLRLNLVYGRGILINGKRYNSVDMEVLLEFKKRYDYIPEIDLVLDFNDISSNGNYVVEDINNNNKSAINM